MKATLDRKQSEAKDIYTFWFKPEKDIRYIAGQFTEIRLKHDDKDKRGDKRFYTLSSSPTEPLVSITTKIIPESSSFKKALQALKPGDQVDMAAAMGDFVLPKTTGQPVLFVAGGIGCTPFRSMVRNMLDTKEKRGIKLLYAANTLEEVAFKTDLKELGKDNVSLILSKPPQAWKGLSGRLDASTVLSKVEDQENTTVYLSGPEPMVESLDKDLKKQGFNKKHIRTDFFPGYTDI